MISKLSQKGLFRSIFGRIKKLTDFYLLYLPDFHPEQPFKT